MGSAQFPSITKSKSLGMEGTWLLAEHLALKMRCLCLTGYIEQSVIRSVNVHESGAPCLASLGFQY